MSARDALAEAEWLILHAQVRAAGGANPAEGDRRSVEWLGKFYDDADAAMSDPTPEPERPEVAWLNGWCLAMLTDLPAGTRYVSARNRPDADCLAVEHETGWDRPVIVVAWPDGSAPVPPIPPSDTDGGS